MPANGRKGEQAIAGHRRRGEGSRAGMRKPLEVGRKMFGAAEFR